MGCTSAMAGGVTRDASLRARTLRARVIVRRTALPASRASLAPPAPCVAVRLGPALADGWCPCALVPALALGAELSRSALRPAGSAVVHVVTDADAPSTAHGTVAVTHAFAARSVDGALQPALTTIVLVRRQVSTIRAASVRPLRLALANSPDAGLPIPALRAACSAIVGVGGQVELLFAGDRRRLIVDHPETCGRAQDRHCRERRNHDRGQSPAG